jgi:hypothetical protein
VDHRVLFVVRIEDRERRVECAIARYEALLYFGVLKPLELPVRAVETKSVNLLEAFVAHDEKLAGRVGRY